MSRRAAAARPSRPVPARHRLVRTQPGATPSPAAPAPGKGAAARQRASGAWLATRLLALLLLSAASGLLYHVATSDEFRITAVRVSGNQLLAASELEAAAAVSGANIFWVREEEVRRRLQTLPAVQSARVTAFLPNRLEIRVGERSPVAVWLAAGIPWLVDAEGRVLGAAQAAVSLPVLRSTDQTGLGPGSQVDVGALEAALQLQRLLAASGTAAREFEYSPETGVSIVADFGPRVHFGGPDDLEWKMISLGAVRRELERTGQRAELIDVRFKDRPYVR